MENNMEHKRRMKNILKEGFLLLAIGLLLMSLTTYAVSNSLISLLTGVIVINVIPLIGAIIATTLPWGKKNYGP